MKNKISKSMKDISREDNPSLFYWIQLIEAWQNCVTFWIGDYPKNINKNFYKKISLIYKTSRLGLLWNLFQHILTFVSCFYFIEDNNEAEIYSRDVVTSVTLFEIIFFVAIVIDLILRYVVAENKVKQFFLKWSVLIDILAIIPIVLLLVLLLQQQLTNNTSMEMQNSYHTGVLRFFRVFKILRLFRVLSLAKLAKTTLYRQAAVIFLSIFIIIYIGANLIVIVEGLNFFHACYFMVVTITTVGYGDYSPQTGLGQFIVCILIATTFSWIPSEISTLIEDVRLVRKYKVRYSPKLGRNFIIIVGNITAPKVNAFVTEFFHPDKAELTSINPVLLSNLENKRNYHKERNWLRKMPKWFRKRIEQSRQLQKSRWALREKNKPYDIILMDSKEPSEGLMELLENPLLERRLIYIEGSALVEEDLERISARYATACFVFTDQHLQDSENEDSTIVLRTLLLKSFQEDMPTVVQLHHTHNRSQLHLVRPQHILCIEEIFMSLMGVSALYPGLCIVLTNMITSSTDKNSSCDILIGSQYYKRPTSKSRGMFFALRSGGLYHPAEKIKNAINAERKRTTKNQNLEKKSRMNKKKRFSIGFNVTWDSDVASEGGDINHVYDESFWLWDYLDATGMEMYTVRAPEVFRGLTFTEACEEVYRALDGDVILLGLEEHLRDENDVDHVVTSILNPGSKYIFYENSGEKLDGETLGDKFWQVNRSSTWVVVIAISQEVANLVATLTFSPDADFEGDDRLEGILPNVVDFVKKSINIGKTKDSTSNQERSTELVELENGRTYIDTYGKKRSILGTNSVNEVFGRYTSDHVDADELDTSNGSTESHPVTSKSGKVLMSSVTWTEIDTIEDVLLTFSNQNNNNENIVPTTTDNDNTIALYNELELNSDENIPLTIRKNESTRAINMHTVVLLPSSRKSLHYLIRPFLQSYLRQTRKCCDIVILSPDTIGSNMKEEVLFQPDYSNSADIEDEETDVDHDDHCLSIPRIFVINGQPSEMEDLERAGIYNCSSCIVVATNSGITDIDEDYVDEHTIKTFLALERALQEPKCNKFTYCIETISMSTLKILDETKRTFEAVHLINNMTNSLEEEEIPLNETLSRSDKVGKRKSAKMVNVDNPLVGLGTEKRDSLSNELWKKVSRPLTPTSVTNDQLNKDVSVNAFSPREYAKDIPRTEEHPINSLSKLLSNFGSFLSKSSGNKKNDSIHFGNSNLGKVFPIKVNGTALPVFLLDTLSVQIFHNPMLVRFLRHFLFLDEYVSTWEKNMKFTVKQQAAPCGRVAQINLPSSFEGENFYELYMFLIQEYELIPISIFRTATYIRDADTFMQTETSIQYPITAPPPELVLEKTDLIFVVGPERKLKKVLSLYSNE